MGCDGGTIPKRDELVKTKKKKETGPKECTYAAKWNYCHLSQLPLQKPIVADRLGNLYNKESVIEYLLDKTRFENGPEILKTLKDVKELKLENNPNFDSQKSESGSEASSLNKAQWICPITGLEMNGMFKFYFLFTCGCVFSERAYKGINNSNPKCLKCDSSYEEYDLLILNPNQEDLKLNEQKLIARKEITIKKSEKKKKHITVSDNLSTNLHELACSSKDAELSNKNVNLKKNDSAEKTTDLAPKRRLETTETSNKKNKSIQDDPNASEVFKSLFTSSSKAKNQTKAHWVTYNPQYF